MQRTCTERRGLAISLFVRVVSGIRPLEVFIKANLDVLLVKARKLRT